MFLRFRLVVVDHEHAFQNGRSRRPDLYTPKMTRMRPFPSVPGALTNRDQTGTSTGATGTTGGRACQRPESTSAISRSISLTTRRENGPRCR